eukprot:13058393-Alexandrium_andersonii.AAC.1
MGASRREHPNNSWSVQLPDAGRRRLRRHENPGNGGFSNECEGHMNRASGEAAQRDGCTAR